MIENLGKYVAELRVQRGLTLRKMEDLTGIPNARDGAEEVSSFPFPIIKIIRMP
jgi:transcriptional regulator with XRE-family HTH domain